VSDRPEQAVNAAGPGAPPSTTHDHEANVDPGTSWYGVRDVSLGQQLDGGAVPVDRPAAWMWLLYAALGFLGGQLLAALLAGAAAAVAGQYHQLAALSKLAEPPTWFVMSTLLGLWGGFLGAGVLASRLRGTSHLVADLGLRFRWIDVLGIPIGVLGQYLVALMYVPIKPHVHDFSQRFSAPAQRLTGGSHGSGYAVIVLATVVGAPFFEELFFRGVLLRSFARLFGRFGGWVGPCLAVLVSGLLFGLAHAESLQLLGLATFGVILGAVSYRTGRLGMNMVAHASFNALALAAVVFPALMGARGLV
jgi:membrane protease YdiL (CAAX protease family)